MATSTVRSTSAARICTIVGFVCAVLALLLNPILFGVIGLVLGVVGAMLGDKPLGWYAAAANVVAMVLSMLIFNAL
jgi:Na+-driven multidrug efflux pump